MALNCRDIESQLRELLLSEVKVRPTTGGCAIELPWRDTLGEPIRVFASGNGDSVDLDDDGQMMFERERLGDLSESARARMSSFLRRLFVEAGATWDDISQLGQTTAEPDVVARRILEFGTVLAGATSAIRVLRDWPRAPRRGSLGQRLASRIYANLTRPSRTNGRIPKRALERVRRRHALAGLANPGWQVDFFYEPLALELGLSRPVVVIAVDLSGRSAAPKAEHAVTMARDLDMANSGYQIRVVHTRDGQREADRVHRDDVRVARRLIEEHARQEYVPYDYDSEEERAKLDRLMRAEIVGAGLAAV